MLFVIVSSSQLPTDSAEVLAPFDPSLLQLRIRLLNGHLAACFVRTRRTHALLVLGCNISSSAKAFRSKAEIITSVSCSVFLAALKIGDALDTSFDMRPRLSCTSMSCQ